MLKPVKTQKKQRLKLIIKCIIRDMSDPFFANVAPGLAYYFLLSIAPIIASVSYFAGFFFLNSSLLVKAINRYLPSELADVLIPFLSQQSPTAGFMATIIFFIFTLYLASRGMYALIKVADYAADTLTANTMKEVPIAFLKRHAKAYLLTCLLILMTIFSLLFMVFGKALLDICIDYAKLRGFSYVLYTMYYYLSYPTGIVIVFFILSVIYALMPAKHLKFKEVIPGATISTLGLIIASIGFVIYIKYFFGNNAIYGALSSIILLILWFFLLAYVLVFGIIVNHAFKDTKDLD